MCGIAGFIDLDASSSAADLENTARRMAQVLDHRGPDDRGAWADPECGVALGHTRLSILDLSKEGHQPMVSASGRYVIAYNGEVYNFQSLKQGIESECGPVAWRGHSDTEVILAAIERWGLDGALSRFVGMFAFALWDRTERRLHLVRDRLGIKPLYYGRCGGKLLFGSELKALERHPDFQKEVRRDSLVLLLRHNCVPGPYSIYEGVFKLPPGHRLTLRLGTDADWPVPVPYWSALEAARRGMERPWQGTAEEAAEELDRLLRDAVSLRLVSDVPLGAFLSGGIDSSTVVAIMRQVATGPVKTFSIGFDESQYDEAPFARAVARHLGTDHTELTVTGQDALNVVPHLPTLYDEPFADSSQIPTTLVSRLARSQVTVALTGDGGDELFGGYAHYFSTLGLASWNRRLPAGFRRALGAALRAVPVSVWDRVLFCFSPLLGRRFRLTRSGEKVHKLAWLLSLEGVAPLYRRILTHWQNAQQVVVGAGDPPFPPGLGAPESAFTDPALYMMFTDSVMYLPEDILTKVDRASMSAGLEARVPLLDHRIYEFAWALPLSYRIHKNTSKWLLRRVLDRYVPRPLIDRPKMGFGIPLAQWLRGPLKDWAADLLDPPRLRQEGYFDAAALEKTWNEHQSGQREWASLLWDVLMFQAWLRRGL